MSLLASLKGLRPTLLTTPLLTPSTTTATTTTTAVRAFSTTPSSPARKVIATTPDYMNKIQNIKQQLFARAPPPLRMARNRHLRHWTIHRAWLLLQRQQREAREKELYRMHQSMWNAHEELRKTAGPGTRDEGWLYRVAQEKKGVYGPNAVPIEYARYQTETPARVAWNHDWKP
ncbi:ring finger domain protein [Colletotrichum karsti]|uniref:Ring finger domain protein n=1 Tax=Colletotrichum karsti TaxID=1095194 RepID=A0A9P6I3I6_9PEZI|nr:ring finger domain protein [Colletotrichum karsti]KAF9876653.1 ring finger domain protein [Colletotrichum karsti]